MIILSLTKTAKGNSLHRFCYTLILSLLLSCANDDQHENNRKQETGETG